MLRKLIAVSIVSLVVVAVVAACDDDSGTVNSGVPLLSGDTAKPVNEVTTQEAKAWCESYKAKASEMYDTTTQCEIAGLMVAMMAGGADIATQCNAVKEQCLANPGEYLEEQDDDPAAEIDCDGTMNDDLKDCDATVGEFNACYDALIVEGQKVMNKISCNMSMEDMMAMQDFSEFGPEQVPACKPLMDKCPELFEGEEDTEYPDVMEQDFVDFDM